MSKQALSANLQSLMMIHGGLSVSELARQTRIPQPTLHHILDGSTKNPRKEALEALAKFFSISVAELVGHSPMPAIIPDSIKSSLQITTIPVIDWEMIKYWQSAKNKIHIAKNIILDRTIDQNAFALTMHDSSLEPLFPENSLLIFDPSKKPKDRDFAISHLTQDDTILFNRLFIDGSGSYIKKDQKDGNAQLVKLKTEDVVIATLVEVRFQL